MQSQVVGIGREVYVFKTPAGNYPRLNKGCVDQNNTQVSPVAAFFSNRPSMCRLWHLSHKPRDCPPLGQSSLVMQKRLKNGLSHSAKAWPEP